MVETRSSKEIRKLSATTLSSLQQARHIAAGHLPKHNSSTYFAAANVKRTQQTRPSPKVPPRRHGSNPEPLPRQSQRNLQHVSDIRNGTSNVYRASSSSKSSSSFTSTPERHPSQPDLGPSELDDPFLGISFANRQFMMLRKKAAEYQQVSANNNDQSPPIPFGDTEVYQAPVSNAQDMKQHLTDEVCEAEQLIQRMMQSETEQSAENLDELLSSLQRIAEFKLLTEENSKEIERLVQRLNDSSVDTPFNELLALLDSLKTYL
ncbi:hypothetical protein Ciccas_010758 [Cichlidogyrus casuarinus]|uniref:Uncharacterized protein n=1 Tax=Cichlidogyrus casuarinus TaxID=1844966 RepID=A0ABD2PTA7_9PLAT